jgi:HD-like signal output (HDOD) protein
MNDAKCLDEFIRGASRLPVLPKVTLRLIEALDSEESTSKDIAGIIEAEPALSARLLKLANSSFYGQRGMVSSIRNAVVVLGSKTIRSLALMVWTQSLRAQARSLAEATLLTPVLAHGLATGVVARMLAERIDRDLGEDAFMSGLLHDIGRVALVAQLGADYQSLILAPAQSESVLLHDKENAVLGFDHRALGAALLKSWSLPPFLISVVEDHHDSEIVPQDRFFVAAVALADYFASSLGMNLSIDTPRTRHEGIVAFFGFAGQESIDAFLAQCTDKIQVLEESIGMDHSSPSS